MLFIGITHTARMMKNGNTNSNFVEIRGKNRWKLYYNSWRLNSGQKQIEESHECKSQKKKKHFCKSQNCSSPKWNAYTKAKHRNFYLQKKELHVWGWFMELLYYQFGSEKQEKNELNKKNFLNAKFQVITEPMLKVREVGKVFYWSLKLFAFHHS